jgi:hypothetical protein
MTGIDSSSRTTPAKGALCGISDSSKRRRQKARLAKAGLSLLGELKLPEFTSDVRHHRDLRVGELR